MSKQTVFENGLIYSGRGNNVSTITTLRDREILQSRSVTLVNNNEFRFTQPLNYIVKETPIINETFQLTFILYVLISTGNNSSTRRVLLRNSALDQDIIYIQNNRIYLVLYNSTNEPITYRTNIISFSTLSTTYAISISVGSESPFIRITASIIPEIISLYDPVLQINIFNDTIDADVDNNGSNSYSQLNIKIDTFGSINNTSATGSDMYTHGLKVILVANNVISDIFNTSSQDGSTSILFDNSGQNNHLLHVKEVLPTSFLINETTSVLDHLNVYGYNKGTNTIFNTNRVIDDVLLYKYFSKVERLTGSVSATQTTTTAIQITIISNVSNNNVDIYYKYPEGLGLSDSQALAQIFDITFEGSGNAGAFIDDIGQIQYRDGAGATQVLTLGLTPQTYNVTVRPFTASGGEGILFKIILNPASSNDLQGTYIIDNLKINSYTINQDVPITTYMYIPVLPDQTVDLLGNTAEYIGQAAFDAYLVNGSAITFEQVTNQYIQFDNLSAANSVTWDGLGILELDIPNDRLNITEASTFYNIKIYDISSNLIHHLPVIEGTGRKLHDVVGGQLTTTTSSINWDNTQDEYFYGQVSGFTISDGSINYNNLPAGIIVPASSINLGEDFYGNIIPNYGRIGYAIFEDLNNNNKIKIKLNKFNAPLLNNLGIRTNVDTIFYLELVGETNALSIKSDRYVRDGNKYKKDFIITSKSKIVSDSDLYNKFYDE